jgi:hypothetical protein
MSQARASHLRLVVNEAPAAAPAPMRLRFRPVVRLADGEAFGLHAETDRQFGEVRFGHHDNTEASAGGWLGDLIERAARLAAETGVTQRPLSVTAPMAALFDRDAPMAAEAACMRARTLPSEIRIDFDDASVTALEDFAMDRLDAFRRKGFRVGLDARTSWRTPMSARARSTFEAVRVDMGTCISNDVPLSRLEAASADGVALIAENAFWRDAADLAGVGVHFAISPRADG